MRFEMSSASIPDPFGGALPQRAPSRPKPSGPKIVKPVPPRPRSHALWLGLAAAAIVAGAGLYLNRDRLAPKEGGGGPGGTVVRTAVIAAGDLHRTLRVTGVITAERFSAIIAPQLRGSRGSMSGSRGTTRGSMSASSSVFGGGSSSGSSGSGSSSDSSSQSASTMTVNSSNSANTSSASDSSGSGAPVQTASSLG